MSNRAARIASAVFATILTGAPITAILHATADAAEGCQTTPGDQTPEGKHWYYRIEHSSNRQCWYLRGEGEKPAQAGLTPRSEKAVEPGAEAAAPQRSLADAHAELPWPQPRVEQNTTTSMPQRPQATPADAANAPAEQRPNVLESTTRGSLIGTRWPDPSGANPTPSPQPATSEVVADAQPDQATTPTQAAAPAAPAAAAAVPAKPTGSLQTLLLVVAGALALAGLIGSAIFRLGGGRRRTPNIDRARRRVVWEAVEGAPQLSPRQSPPRQSPPRQSSPQTQPHTPPHTPPWVDPEYARRPGFSPALNETSNHNEPSNHNERLDEISEFLERMSKQPSN
jgi:hypothetical protein